MDKVFLVKCLDKEGLVVDTAWSTAELAQERQGILKSVNKFDDSDLSIEEVLVDDIKNEQRIIDIKPRKEIKEGKENSGSLDV